MISRRLKALIGLCEGRTPAEIRTETGFSPEGLRKIQIRVDTKGLESDLEKVRLSLDSAQAAYNQDQEKPRPGRPAITSLSAWADVQHPEQEPVIELVQFVITATAKWATFGMRPGRARGEGTKWSRATSVEKLFTGALDADEGLDWTAHGLDFSAEFIFRRMRENLPKMKGCEENLLSLASLRGRDIMANSSDGWRFVIMHTGNTSIRCEINVAGTENRRFR